MRLQMRPQTKFQTFRRSFRQGVSEETRDPNEIQPPRTTYRAEQLKFLLSYQNMKQFLELFPVKAARRRKLLIEIISMLRRRFGLVLLCLNHFVAFEPVRWV